MEKEKEILKKHSGKCFYALVTRQGNRYQPIHRLVTYKITPHGSIVFEKIVMDLVANKPQKAEMLATTKGQYFRGRPSGKKIAKIIEAKGKLDLGYDFGFSTGFAFTVSNRVVYSKMRPG